MNILALGEDQAQHLGVEIEKVKRILLISGALLTAAAVSISGLIGFVGLIIPHLTRVLIGPDHRVLLPTSAIVGAAFLMICDAISRIVMGSGEAPVGIITALAGATLDAVDRMGFTIGARNSVDLGQGDLIVYGSHIYETVI